MTNPCLLVHRNLFSLCPRIPATTPHIEHEIELRLKWRHTWPDREADFVAEAPTYSGNVGQIYYVPEHHGPKAGSWYWAFQAFADDISRNIGHPFGHEPSARETAARVEAAWFAASRGRGTMSRPCRLSRGMRMRRRSGGLDGHLPTTHSRLTRRARLRMASRQPFGP